eukprot:364814-Chlamydomonas_euryale.AAC.3
MLSRGEGQDLRGGHPSWDGAGRHVACTPHTAMVSFLKSCQTDDSPSRKEWGGCGLAFVVAALSCTSVVAGWEGPCAWCGDAVLLLALALVAGMQAS